MTTKTRRMDVRAPTDTELIVASSSDPDAFGILFDRHVRAIHRFSGRRVGASLANDVTAETFTVAFARRGDFDPKMGEVLPWLYGIASNVMRAMARVERRQLLELARLKPDVSEPLEDVVARVDAATAYGVIAKALAGLKQGDREALLLHAWAGLNYGAIAQALRIPTGTVGSRLNRARRVLRRSLREAGWFQDGDNEEVYE